MKKTKIIATLGPASTKKETVKAMILEGMNIIRLNMSHGDYEEQMERVNIVRALNEELGTNVAILLDTKGPEVRTGLFEEKKVLLEKGNEVVITMDDVVGTSQKFTVSYKGLTKDLKAGDIILLDDGYVSVKVKEIKGNDIVCEILNTGYMKDRRGVNVPGVTLNFEFMSEKDKNDILWACENNLDFIAASFVRNKQDLQEIYDVINTTNNKDIKVLSKIESQDGTENVDDIIALGDGIMIARGDLGVEIPAEDVPGIQKSIIKKCNKANKVVVTATQMLESMQANPRPTRAEVSDVYNAIMDGTDAVMLSGESAAGDYPVESVAMQATIAKKAESIFDYEGYLYNMSKNLEADISDLVSYSAVSTADKLNNVKLIIAITNSGATARKISRLKPKTPIVAVTPNADVARRLNASFGVYSAVIEKFSTIDELLEAAIEKAKEKGLIKSGDDVVISSGSIYGKGNTDLMKVRSIK
ncbi:MAG: pyruvate kinase [Mycoplasmatales bacterium]